jgi:hypothetical protein
MYEHDCFERARSTRWFGTYKVAFDSRSREVAQGDDKHNQNTNAEQGSQKHYKECSTCATEHGCTSRHYSSPSSRVNLMKRRSRAVISCSDTRASLTVHGGINA